MNDTSPPDGDTNDTGGGAPPDAGSTKPAVDEAATPDAANLVAEAWQPDRDAATAVEPVEAVGPVGSDVTPPPPVAPEGMAAELARLEADAAAGKIAEARRIELAPLVVKKAKSQDDYAAKRPAMVKQWMDQRQEVWRLYTALTACVPNWADVIQHQICPVLDAITAQEVTVAGLQHDLGLEDGPVANAEAKAKASKALLEDKWLKVDVWLQDQLTTLASSIKKLEQTLIGPEAGYGIYILWFEVLPLLRTIAPRSAEAGLDDLDKALAGPTCLPKPGNDPWLLPADKLSAQQDEVWSGYEDDRTSLEAARAKIKATSDNLAAATATLRTLKGDRDKAIHDALKKIPVATAAT